MISSNSILFIALFILFVKTSNAQPQTIPENICGLALKARGQSIVKFLAKHSSYTSLKSSSSPQHQAMCWLIHNDARKLSVGMTSNKQKFLQRYSLSVLYFATQGATKWIKNEHWLSKKHECDWYGIECDIFGHVVTVDLAFNELEGIIPREIALIKYLRNLELQANELQGVIPVAIGELVYLEKLKLFMNGFFGAIPSSIGKCKNLKEFIIFGTYLMGGVPKELGDLKKLEVLDMYGNHFSGTVPTQLQQLSKLEEVYLNDNNLVGTVPTLKNKNIEMWADCRVGTDGKAEVKCDSCSVCCNDKASPKCMRRASKKNKSSSKVKK